MRSLYYIQEKLVKGIRPPGDFLRHSTTYWFSWSTSARIPSATALGVAQNGAEAARGARP
jgi:hypothetical protein